MFPATCQLGRGQAVKALVFGISIPRFESWRPSQFSFFAEFPPSLPPERHAMTIFIPINQRVAEIETPSFCIPFEETRA